jgi:uncharacterized membrane protein YfcA
MYCLSVDVVTIGIAALATSVLSAVAGLGGGIILLAVIAQFFAPTVAIPIQGAMQFVANGSRAALIRREISWPAVWWSSLLIFPASVLGVVVATSIPEDATRLVLGLFVLVVAWKPSLLRWRGGRPLPTRAMIGVGAASGFLNSTVGASGPVTSPFFKAVTASHVAFVATAAASQVIAHTSKIIAFTLDDFSLLDHLDVIVVGSIGVSLGSFIGTRLLGRISEERLALVFKIVLTALAVRLVAQSAI